MSKTEEKWWNNFNEVHKFYTENGHLTSLPTDRLQRWITYQRHRAKALSKEQLQALESVEYTNVRVCRKNEEERWKLRVSQLAKDKSLMDKSPSIQKWIYRQRWMKENGKLSAYRIKILEESGIDLRPINKRGQRKSAIRDKQWNENFEKLQEYKAKYGDTNVPQSRSLGPWVALQRKRYRLTDANGVSVLEKERIDKLNGIGFVWCLRERPVHFINS